METVNTLLASFSGHPLILFLILFVIMLFIGEPLVLSLAFLSATNNLISFWQILIIAFLTAIIGELFWFGIARTKLFTHVGSFQIFKPISNEFSILLKNTKLTTPFRLLFITRVITGLTIAAIVYLSRQGLPIVRFLKVAVVVNLFWTPIVVSVGYSAGKGYTLLLSTFQKVQFSVEIGLIIFLVLYFLYQIIIKHYLYPSKIVLSKLDKKDNMQ